MCPTRTNAEDPRFNFTSTDNAVIIKLFSDDSVQKHGFLLKYVENLSETTTTTTTQTTTTAMRTTTTNIDTSSTTTPTTGATSTCELDIAVVAGSAAAGAALGVGVVGAIWAIQHQWLRNVKRVQPFAAGR
ncbi:hypothetical protein MAR_022805 [Mya arenaria]|uniref:CUB domain-containing protein n=2 Tax=Mya arenaria TaxID=6604 RepID=A0ABY7DNY5_MYAAR|nr:hypothetical protein MAR_022805 [Mya arenaria]